MRILIMIIISLSFSMSGCTLLQAKGEVGGIEVEAQAKDNKNEGEFCPPGQAKKDNC